MRGEIDDEVGYGFEIELSLEPTPDEWMGGI